MRKARNGRHESEPFFMRRLHAGSNKPASFFRRHSRLLSFVGALIVFFTFVIKEGLSEAWKDDASQITLAEYFYLVRTDTSAIRSKVTNIELRLTGPKSDADELQTPLADSKVKFTDKSLRVSQPSDAATYNQTIADINRVGERVNRAQATCYEFDVMEVTIANLVRKVTNRRVQLEYMTSLTALHAKLADYERRTAEHDQHS